MAWEASGITMLHVGGISWLLENEGNVNLLRKEKQGKQNRKPNFVASSA